MLELKDGKKILTTPVSEEDLKDIHIGDIVYLNGSMTTCNLPCRSDHPPA